MRRAFAFFGGVPTRLIYDNLKAVVDAVYIGKERQFNRRFLAVLEKKPGALRNGAPFVAWDLPRAIQMVRDRILKQPKGDRAFVELLILAGEAGLDALTVACELTLECGVVSAPVVMNELRRLIAPHLPAATINVPDGIALTIEPIANCNRYDHLLGSANVH